MSQNSSDKFLYFTVGLLKGSAALDALRQDATKFHMIDHPGQLIALRLTEYYEQMKQGSTQPVVQTPAVNLSPESETTAGNEQTSSAETYAPQRSVPHGRLPAPIPSTDHSESTNTPNQFTGKMRALRRENENVVSVSSAAEQNADEAADYWSTL